MLFVNRTSEASTAPDAVLGTRTRTRDPCPPVANGLLGEADNERRGSVRTELSEVIWQSDWGEVCCNWRGMTEVRRGTLAETQGPRAAAM